MITWSRDQSVKRLSGWWPFTINLHLVKFGSHGPRGSGDVSFFISYVTSCDHVIIGSSLSSVVTIILVEVEIWFVLIFNVRRRIHMHMIILLQCVTIQFGELFWHISYDKVWQTVITKCIRYYKVWQIAVTKCVRYYKVWKALLQSASGITKCDSYYKVRRNTLLSIMLWDGQTCFKNLAVWTPQDLESIFGHFTTLCMKGLIRSYFLPILA